MGNDDRIRDFDILAYADGRLDDDPARLAAVERALEAHPELAARAAAYRAQTEALRRAYGPRLADPVPDRLRRAIEGRRRGTAGALARVAAAVLLAAVAGAGGWFAGRAERTMEASTMHAILAHAEPATTAAGPPGPLLAQDGPAAPLGWLSRDIALRLRAPDLSRFGFTLIGREAVDIDGRRAARLTYRAAGGSRFYLFLRPRWTDRPPNIQFAETNGIHLAYWADGPLSTAVASDMPQAELRPIVEAIRDALRHPGAEPRIAVESPAAVGRAGSQPSIVPAPEVPGRAAHPAVYPVSGDDGRHGEPR